MRYCLQLYCVYIATIYTIYLKLYYIFRTTLYVTATLAAALQIYFYYNKFQHKVVRFDL